MISELTPTRKRLLSSYGVSVRPGVLEDIGIRALIALCHVPKDYVGLVGNVHRDLINLRAGLPVVVQAVAEAWESAYECDVGAYGSGAWHRAAMARLLPYESILRSVSLASRVAHCDIRGFAFVNQWGDRWIALCDEAMEGGTAVGDYLRSLPSWKRACAKRRADKSFVRRVLKRARERLEAHLWWAAKNPGKDGKWSSDSSVDMVHIDEVWLKKWSSRFSMIRQEDGYVVPLRDLVENAAKNRRAEDYALSIGIQRMAEEKGLQFVLATITLPGRYSPKQGFRASDWNGCSPADANVALKGLMHRIRTNLVDSVSTCIGFCVTEPQKTGVPHCHVMILTDDPAAVERIVLMYRENDRHQIDVRRWHLEPGEHKASSIASYLTKYLMKGHEGGPRAPDGSPYPVHSWEYVNWQDEQRRFSAWRRGAAARTVSWFGLGRGFKSRWRAVFRAALTDDALKIKDPVFVKVLGSMASKDWGAALQAVSQVKWEPVYKIRKNRYDEEVVDIVGYVLGDRTVLSLENGVWELNEDVLDHVEPSWVDFDEPWCHPPFDPQIDAILREAGL